MNRKRKGEKGKREEELSTDGRNGTRIVERTGSPGGFKGNDFMRPSRSPMHLSAGSVCQCQRVLGGGWKDRQTRQDKRGKVGTGSKIKEDRRGEKKKPTR